jgi:hypothetical protein
MLGLLSNAAAGVDNNSKKKKLASYEPETRTEKNHYPGQMVEDQEEVEAE